MSSSTSGGSCGSGALNGCDHGSIGGGRPAVAPPWRRAALKSCATGDLALPEAAVGLEGGGDADGDGGGGGSDNAAENDDGDDGDNEAELPLLAPPPPISLAIKSEYPAAPVEHRYSEEPSEEIMSGAIASASEHKDKDRAVDDEQEDEAGEEEALQSRATATMFISSKRARLASSSSEVDDYCGAGSDFNGRATSGGASVSSRDFDALCSVPTVVLVDDQGLVLKHYALQKHAAVDLSLSTNLVSKCLRGLVPNAKGHRLKAFKEGTQKYTSKVQDEANTANVEFGLAEEEAGARGQATYGDMFPAEPDHKRKAVVLLDDQGVVFEEYASQIIAAEALGLSQASVSRSVRGQMPKASGHRLRAFDPSGVYPTLKSESWGKPGRDNRGGASYQGSDGHDDGNDNSMKPRAIEASSGEAALADDDEEEEEEEEGAKADNDDPFVSPASGGGTSPLGKLPTEPLGKLHTSAYRAAPPKGASGDNFTWWICDRARSFIEVWVSRKFMRTCLPQGKKRGN
jgi:hypothetical protein